MATINIKKKDWPDIVVAFILDKMMKGDEILAESEEFTKLVKVMEIKGLKPVLLHYYLSSDANTRSKYKVLRKVFKSGKSPSGAIYINASTKDIKKDKKGMAGTIKFLIKKALKLVVAHKKKSGFPLSEEKVDKILDNLLIEEGVLKDERE